MSTVNEQPRPPTGDGAKRRRIVRPYPVHSLEETVPIAVAIQEKNAGLPFDRVLLAKALNTTPASSGFTMKLSSSAKYGLTSGGYNDDRIVLTARGESVVGLRRQEDRSSALLEAALQPEHFRRFYEILDGKRLPEDDGAKNLLERDIGLQAELTEECLGTIKANGIYVGILGEVGGSLYVSAVGAHAPVGRNNGGTLTPVQEAPSADVPQMSERSARDKGRIFIGHAGNSDIVDYLKTVLDSFGIDCRAVECDFDVSRPIGEEVAAEMRGCTAGVFVFAPPSDEAWSGRREEKRHQKLLYQLGAASALYGDKVILVRGSDMEAGSLDPGFETLEFQPNRPTEIGLPLIAELHQMGVIEVRA